LPFTRQGSLAVREGSRNGHTAIGLAPRGVLISSAAQCGRISTAVILRAMETASSQMNDYRLIYNPDQTPFTPADSITLHNSFTSKLLNWFGKNLSGPRVVISHNAPVINPNSKYKASALARSFPITVV
jgi:hypothetical protein